MLLKLLERQTLLERRRPPSPAQRRRADRLNAITREQHELFREVVPTWEQMTVLYKNKGTHPQESFLAAYRRLYP
jgi:hypothetical protein